MADLFDGYPQGESYRLLRLALHEIDVLRKSEPGTLADAVAAWLPAETQYRLWVNAERTMLVRLWPSGKVEVATRETPEHTWGPPIYLDEDKTA